MHMPESHHSKGVRKDCGFCLILKKLTKVFSRIQFSKREANLGVCASSEQYWLGTSRQDGSIFKSRVLKPTYASIQSMKSQYLEVVPGSKLVCFNLPMTRGLTIPCSILSFKSSKASQLSYILPEMVLAQVWFNGPNCFAQLRVGA